jgi:hypothetical protein
MPLDGIQDKLINLNANLNFDVVYEPTKMEDHKYVVREDVQENILRYRGESFKL